MHKSPIKLPSHPSSLKLGLNLFQAIKPFRLTSAQLMAKFDWFTPHGHLVFAAFRTALMLAVSLTHMMTAMPIALSLGCTRRPI